MGEQDVADQQGAFLCREDLTFVGSFFVIAFSFPIHLFKDNLSQIHSLKHCQLILKAILLVSRTLQLLNCVEIVKELRRYKFLFTNES